MSSKDKELSKLKAEVEKKEKDIGTLTSLSKKLEEKYNLIKNQVKKQDDPKSSECEIPFEEHK